MVSVYIEDAFVSNIVLRDETTFHLSGTVSRHNVQIWNLENPNETTEHAKDSPEVLYPRTKCMGSSFSRNRPLQVQHILRTNSVATLSSSLEICKGSLYSPMPQNLHELKIRIIDSCESVDT
jgi:hypothetical protein